MKRGDSYDGGRPIAQAVPHACATCRRRYMVIPGRGITDPPGCVCGSRIEPACFASGVYEVRRSRRASRRRPREALPYGRGSSAEAGGALAEREPDHGYGESHGYGPAHGGPTGPADAPAPADSPKSQSDDAA